MTNINTIGIIGAGRVGTALGRQALKAGYDVRIATAKPPAEIALIIDLLVPGARATSVEMVVGGSDLVVLALPLSRYRALQPALFTGKIVIDAMNYWAPVDGQIPEFDAAEGSSTVIQRVLPGARLVRTLNHIGYHEMEDLALPRGHADRLGLAIASDDAVARDLVAGFIDRLGYDPVDAGPLASGRKFDAGTPIFGGRLRASQIRRLLEKTASPAQAAE